MNLRTCFICGGDGVELTSSYHEPHYYHQDCLSLAFDEGLLLDCDECLLEVLGSSQSDNSVCIRCLRESCDSEIKNLCLECRNQLNFKTLLTNSSRFSCTFCRRIKKNQSLENSINESSIILCSDCFNQKFCNSCRNPLDKHGHLCKCGNCYDSSCFKNYCEEISKCDYCRYVYISKFCEIKAIFLNIYCKYCHSETIQITDERLYCLNLNYYCRSCLCLPEVVELRTSCKCQNCNLTEEIKRKSKKCTNCKKYSQEYEMSDCGKFLVCGNCTSNPSEFNDFLIRCIAAGCQTCLSTLKDKLRRCAVCANMSFVLERNMCEKNRYYCEDCLNNPQKVNEIITICKCQICLNLFSFKNQNLYKNKFNVSEVSINSHVRVEPDNETMFLGRPLCSHCNQDSDFALSCNHNQCFLCIIKENLHLFYDFLHNLKTKKIENIANKFQVKCCSENCNFKFDLSFSSLFELKDNLFRKEDFDTLSQYVHYLEGINFQFELCKCRTDPEVVAYYNDIKIGCLKCKNP